MDLGLTGKRALVLASSAGLGLGVAEKLAAEGASVFLTARSSDKLAAAADAIGKAGGKAAYLAADLAPPGAIDAILTEAERALGGVDILVNNSGGPPPGSPSSISAESWAAEFGKMVVPLFEITRRLVPGMRERKWGRVLTIASSGIIQPIPNLPISNALRSAIVGWMKSLSLEVAADGVTVNIVAPGRIDTDRVKSIDKAAADKSGKSQAEVASASMATIPAARYGTVEEFASVVTFLASAPASYVTGSIIRVDGGMIRSI